MWPIRRQSVKERSIAQATQQNKTKPRTETLTQFSKTICGRSVTRAVLLIFLTTYTAMAQPNENSMVLLSDRQVSDFTDLALSGLKREYPNKPSNVMATAEDVLSPKEMHPAFYGNFDWHSSVHGHWMLARLLHLYPEHPRSGDIRSILNGQLTAANMLREAEYFQRPHNRSFERMYGWAWLLQLVRELHEWQDKDAIQWRTNLEPLENVVVAQAMNYLPKLKHPIRVGTHTDTGFALSMELDYSRAVGNEELEALIVRKAKEFYLNDRDYPAHYEPSGHDFFSSGFNEADLMRRVLEPKEFSEWLGQFLPNLGDGDLGGMIQPVEVTDVTDGHLVHLAGLDLSRAWTMSGIANSLPNTDRRRHVLEAAIKPHVEAGLKYVNSGHYEGEHWLATFAVYHLTNSGLEVKR